MILLSILYVYLGTVAVSYWTTKFVELAFIKKAVDQGYDVNVSLVQKNKKQARKDNLNILRASATPIINIAATITAIVQNEEVYNMWLDASLKIGDIKPSPEKRKEDAVNNLVDNLWDNREEHNNYVDVNVNVNNTIIPFDLEPKTYNDMTTEEKINFLDKERIGLINSQLQQKSIDKPKSL